MKERRILASTSQLRPAFLIPPSIFGYAVEWALFTKEIEPCVILSYQHKSVLISLGDSLLRYEPKSRPHLAQTLSEVFRKPVRALRRDQDERGRPFEYRLRSQREHSLDKRLADRALRS